MELLRADVLAGVRVALAAPLAGPGQLGRVVAERAEALGAGVVPLAIDPSCDEPSAGESPAGDDRVDALVWDGDAALAGAPGVDGVRATLDGAWLAIRPIAVGAWIGDDRPGGLIVLLAPRPGDAHAQAARAGLENLARTLSIEWARFGVRPVAVLPGERTAAGEVAELAAYLASPAGAYYSGCAFTLV